MSENDLPSRVKYWLREAKHDCFFVVGLENKPTERIGAIKALLMGDSEPFRAMLQDSPLAREEDIRVTDIEPETFRDFLKCVYGATAVVVPKLSFEECAKLLYVTEKYLLYDIKNYIVERMVNLFSFENVFIALSYSVCCQEANLKEKIMTWLKSDFEKIIAHDKFLELNYDVILWIVQQEELNVEEIHIWNATLQWAKHKTSSSDGKVLREYIFGLLKYIRFLTMDYKEFWKRVVSSEILFEEEVYKICKSFGTDEQCAFEHLCTNNQNRYNLYPVSTSISSSITVTPKFALLTCLVSSVSDLQYGYHDSQTYIWAGHLWSFSVVRDGQEDESLWVCICCKEKNCNSNIEVDIEISLVNQTGKPDIKVMQTTTFTPSLQEMESPSLYGWSDLVNANNGFIKDNTIIFTTKITLKDE